MGANDDRKAPPDFVSVSGISKSFGRGFALQDVGFTVRAGEVLGLIGPNGAGKTTLRMRRRHDGGGYRNRSCRRAGPCSPATQGPAVLFARPDRALGGPVRELGAESV